MKPCFTTNQTTCQSKHRTEFMRQNLFSECDCPQECEKVLYEYSLSFAEYPTKYYFEILRRHPTIQEKFNNKSKEITYDDLKSRIASVNIFYEELKETWITQEKKLLPHDLASNLGGTLGLFLGESNTKNTLKCLNFIFRQLFKKNIKE
jgi:hypothetical protein